MDLAQPPNQPRPQPARVRAEAGASLRTESAAPRPCGRIAGVAGLTLPRRREALARMAARLGPGARLLDADDGRPRLVADWDQARLGERLLADPDQLGAALRRDERCLAELEGGFALAWSDASGALHLARDAIGERGLCYAPLAGGLVFGPGVAALVASGLVERRIDPAGLARYLAYAYLPGRGTLLDGVFELLPGEHAVWRDGRLERRAFWSLPAEPARDEGEEPLRHELRAELERATRARLPEPGEPVAALLSGGLDSSLVVALARGLHHGPLACFSICFGAGHRDELEFSGMLARHCGTPHHVLELPADVVLHHLDDALGLLPGPNGDPLTVPNALVFRELAGFARVALTGEGGDPCFGGPKNLPMLLSELYAGTLAQPSLQRRCRDYLRAHQKCFDDLPGMLRPALDPARLQRRLEQELEPWLSDPRWPRLVSRLQAVNVAFKGAHHILPKVDGESFAAGVLARSPLFDRRVVELAARIPPALKLRGSVEKHLLKRAAADLLPASILERPKSGMLVPVEAWFRGPLLRAARERLLDGLAPRGLLRSEWLEQLLAGRGSGLRPRRGARLWQLLALEAWLRRCVDEPAPCGAPPAG